MRVTDLQRGMHYLVIRRLAFHRRPAVSAHVKDLAAKAPLIKTQSLFAIALERDVWHYSGHGGFSCRPAAPSPPASLRLALPGPPLALAYPFDRRRRALRARCVRCSAICPLDILLSSRRRKSAKDR